MVKATAFALSFPAAEVRHVEALRPGFRTETGAAGSEITAASDWVSPGFFEASGMALVRGSDLSWQDVAGQPDVAVATARMAQLLFADADPLGAARANTDREAGDDRGHRRRRNERRPSHYRISADLPADYGLLSYSVAQRRREIGVRSALGTARARILSLVVGEGVVITCLGIVAGIPLAGWAQVTVGALLFQAPPVDSVAILITIAVVALASGIASAVPARTAARLAPSQALRHL